MKSVETKVTTTCVPNEQRWCKNQLRFDIQMRLECWNEHRTNNMAFETRILAWKV